MLLPVNYVAWVSFNMYTYSEKSCYKSYHGHRKKKVITLCGIILLCICVTPCTPLMCQQCSGSGCVHCKTGQAYCCGGRSWGKRTNVLKYPAVICPTALWLYSPLISFPCDQMAAFQISSGAFWCLVCDCVSPGCCGGWAANSQRETCFSPAKMCSPSWLLECSIIL